MMYPPRKTNKVWTFLFSLLPGAAHMYMGFMKRGIVLMMAFFGLIAVGAMIRVGQLFLFLPVLWCYAFFDALNLAALPEEELQNHREDDLLLDKNTLDRLLPAGKIRLWAGIALIVVGCYFLLSSLVQRLMNLYWGHTIVYEVLNGILDSLPRLLFCGVIIVIGILLIGGKRPKEVEANDEE